MASSNDAPLRFSAGSSSNRNSSDALTGSSASRRALDMRRNRARASGSNRSGSSTNNPSAPRPPGPKPNQGRIGSDSSSGSHASKLLEKSRQAGAAAALVLGPNSKGSDGRPMTSQSKTASNRKSLVDPKPRAPIPTRDDNVKLDAPSFDSAPGIDVENNLPPPDQVAVHHPESEDMLLQRLERISQSNKKRAKPRDQDAIRETNYDEDTALSVPRPKERKPPPPQQQGQKGSVSTAGGRSASSQQRYALQQQVSSKATQRKEVSKVLWRDENEHELRQTRQEIPQWEEKYPWNEPRLDLGEPSEYVEEEANVANTVEEVEPQVDELAVDAACLKDGWIVRLQPYSINNHFCTKEQNFPSSQDDSDASEETFVVPTSMELRLVDGSFPYLCYGSRIQLYASSSKLDEDHHTRKCIGVMESTNQVRLVAGKEDDLKNNESLQWQILRGDSNTHLVRVGTAALEKASHPSALSTSAIHSGDPILLRHVPTGGLLSLDSISGEWCVLTSSYQQEEEPSWEDLVPKDSNDLPLNKLRDQSLIVPSTSEVFSLVVNSIPWTTAWDHGGPLACRKFLVKSHLKFQTRHREVAVGGERPELDYLSDNVERAKNEQQSSMLGQEQILVEELLGSYLGLEGTFIRVKSPAFDVVVSRDHPVRFCLEKDNQEGTVHFDRGMRAIVEDLLNIPNCFAVVEEFVAKRSTRFEYGSVMQSLCACLDGMLQEHSSDVAALEDDYRSNGSMSLRELQVASRPLLDKLLVLNQVVIAASDKQGGALINGLRRLLVDQYQGNAYAEQLLEKILDAASFPFMEMLKEWLTNGLLDDPYQEFMVQCQRDSIWDDKYILDSENTLDHFFPTSVEARRALLAGKYWDAVRKAQGCENMGDGVKQDHSLRLQYRANGAEVASQIQKLYRSASQTLLRVLMEKCDLLGSLRLMKRYFLLDQGDFFLNFLDAAEDELSREPAKLRQFRVQHLLQLSIQITENHREATDDIVSDYQISPVDLTCRFATDSLVDQLTSSSFERPQKSKGSQNLLYTNQDDPIRTGVDLFLLEFAQVPYPLSLVLSSTSLASYRLLFRHLFFAKHVERKLVTVWQDHLATKEFTAIRSSMGPTYLLRQRMLHCVQNLIYYMMFEVIEPNWIALMREISTNMDQTPDDIIATHQDFLDQTLAGCLLSNRDFVLAFTRVMQTCLLFSRQMETFIKKVRLHQDRHRLALENRERVQKSLLQKGSGLMDSPSAMKSTREENDEKMRRVNDQSRRLERELSSPEFRRMISHYDQCFNKHLLLFMKVATKSDETEDRYRTQKLNLCTRLDFNGYVSQSM